MSPAKKSIEVTVKYLIYSSVVLLLAFGFVYIVRSVCCKINYLDKVEAVERHLSKALKEITFVDSHMKTFSVKYLEHREKMDLEQSVNPDSEGPQSMS